MEWITVFDRRILDNAVRVCAAFVRERSCTIFCESERRPPMTRADAGKTTEDQGRGRAKRFPYEKPEIVDRGPLVEIAMGGSPGGGDSGSGAFIEDPMV